jgi:triacylglycerol esterase/lipase EstA (alpha/beta hydrolase family)
MLKYPVLLVHGAGFRDKTLGFINYWGRIPELFSKHGVDVFYGGTDAWGSIENNAEVIRNKINDILNETKAEKVNIIAHSRGGLEARYLISTMNMAHTVASLTTISTPHHGVKAMNVFIAITDGDNDGLCPVESAKWGDYKGVITTKGIFGISHSGIIDLYRVNYKGQNIPDFYLGIVKELSGRGL